MFAPSVPTQWKCRTVAEFGTRLLQPVRVLPENTKRPEVGVVFSPCAYDGVERGS